MASKLFARLERYEGYVMAMENDSAAFPDTNSCMEIQDFYRYVRYIRTQAVGEATFVTAIKSGDSEPMLVLAFMNLCSAYSRLATNRKDVRDRHASMYFRRAPATKLHLDSASRRIYLINTTMWSIRFY